MVTVHEINDPAELALTAPLWDELLQRTPGATFFHSWAFLSTYWRHYGRGKRLRVLVVHDDNQPIGIVPLIVCRVHRSEPIRVLTYPLGDWGNIYGPIGPDPLTAFTAALEHIRRTPRDWQMMELPWVDAVADEGRTQRALESANFHVHCETQNECATIDFAKHGSWQAYCASRNSRWRSNLQREEKAVASAGEISYVRFRASSAELLQGDPRWDLYDTCETISRSSWQHTSRTGTTLSKERFRNFYRDCHQAAAERGEIDINLLFVGGKPAAFGYCYCRRGHLTLLKIGNDPSVACKSTGSVLQARTIADCFARGDLSYDMGPEFLGWKQKWSTHLRPIHRYVHFPPTSVMAQLVRGKRAMLRWWRGRWAAGQTSSGNVNGAAPPEEKDDPRHAIVSSAID